MSDVRQQRHLLAVGIISAPHYLERRLGIRHSWLQWSNVQPGASILARFIVRSGDAPGWLHEMLDGEQARYGDVLRMPSVAWNESRLRGPMLSLAAWLQYAADHLADRVAFVAKMDDDAYLHAPDFERLLRTVESQVGSGSSDGVGGAAASSAGSSRHVYIGSMTWFHWQPAIFERSGHGWNYGQALRTGATCRNATSATLRCGGAPHPCGGACVGPFAFASGYLLVLSAPTATWLAREGGLMRDDATRLRGAADGTLVSPSGKPRDKMMEDVWLGSLLFRDPPPRPLAFVTLVGWQGLLSDAWGLETSRQALLTHVKAKSLPRLLALHEYTTRRHCAPRLELLRCETGCASFAGKYRGGGEEVVRGGRPAFCRGTQRDVRRCVFEEPPTPRRDGCCAAKACVAKVNLLEGGGRLPSAAEAQQRRVLDDNGAMLKLLPAPDKPPPRKSPRSSARRTRQRGRTGRGGVGARTL